MFEFDPPRRLVHGWQSLYDPELAAEEPSRVTWEIEPQVGGFCKLTVTHDQLEGAPKTAESVYGEGWTFVISGLKTLLETGSSLGAERPVSSCANMCSCRTRRRSCTPTSTRSTRRSSSATIRACAVGR